ncbi:hypothetical protein F4678DRAFT_420348 [Xylaria arbuscula]|nr:hypothetical protein F4678DRAFT_420348 [Xylaria arbuscula]
MALRSKAVSLSTLRVAKASSSSPSSNIYSTHWVSSKKPIYQPPKSLSSGNYFSENRSQRVPKKTEGQNETLRRLKSDLIELPEELSKKKRPKTRNSKTQRWLNQYLKPYATVVVNRTCAELGPFFKFFQGKRNVLTDPLLNPLRRHKSLALFERYTRQIKLLRLWFLDYQLMGDILVIIGQIARDDRLKREVPRVKSQLHEVVRGMTNTTSPRHVEQYSKSRRHLLTIADALRKFDSECIDKAKYSDALPEEKDGRRDIISSRLRTVETNLLITEVLCMELVVRKVLIKGPDIVRDTLRQLRKLGYEPTFEELTVVEPVIRLSLSDHRLLGLGLTKGILPAKTY